MTSCGGSASTGCSATQARRRCGCSCDGPTTSTTSSVSRRRLSSRWPMDMRSGRVDPASPTSTPPRGWATRWKRGRGLAQSDATSHHRRTADARHAADRTVPVVAGVHRPSAALCEVGDRTGQGRRRTRGPSHGPCWRLQPHRAARRSCPYPMTTGMPRRRRCQPTPSFPRSVPTLRPSHGSPRSSPRQRRRRRAGTAGGR